MAGPAPVQDGHAMAGLGGGDGPDGGDRKRCPWASGPWLVPYHDHEWGVPVRDERQHFELLVLEGAQAGLSWLSVLKRREAYRRAFAGFEPDTVAGFGPRHVDRLLANPGIIRNRRKIESAIANAGALCRLRDEVGPFHDYLLDRIGGHRIVNGWRTPGEVPAATPVSEELSRDLRRRGFRYVGPVVCYSHLQAAGLVMDHLRSCFRYEALAGIPSASSRHRGSPPQRGVEAGGQSS